jgi:DNA-directed RNA polymerase II subunit RPB2
MERYTEERLRILGSLFRGPSDLTRHHHDSYNRLITSQIPLLLSEISPIKIPLVQKDRAGLLERGAKPELTDGGADDSATISEIEEASLTDEDRQDMAIYKGFDSVVTLYIGNKEGDIRIRKPVIYDENEKGDKVASPMYPNEARLRNLTYSAPVTADIHIRILNIRNGISKTDTMKDVPLFDIPILVRSKPCWLYEMSPDSLAEAGEDPDDPGGYFIVNGAERLLVSQERVIPNLPYITSDPEVMMACSSPNSTRVRVLRLSFDTTTRGIVVSVPGVKGKVPIAILFRALGVINDIDIVRHIFGTENPDNEESNIIRDTLASGHGIYDQHSAIRFLAHLSRGLTIMSARTIIHQQLFPQQTGGLPEKTAILGYLTRLLIHRRLERVSDTDRDNFRSKKLAITGSLMAELLSNVFTTREEEIRKRISSEYNYNNKTYRDDNVFQLLTTIQTRKDYIFGAGDNTSLIMRSIKGQWGADPERGIKAQVEGVSQAMDRLTYLASLSHLRRVALERVPEGRALGARRQHMSSFGYICPSETPSGGPKIGVVKNLAILTRISAGVTDKAVYEILPKMGVIPVKDVPAAKRSRVYSIFVNGVLAGYSPNGLDVHDKLISMRRRGILHPTVSVALMRMSRYVWISTGSGRLMRPLLRVKDGRPMIREALAQLEEASGSKDPDSVFSFTPFVTDEPDSAIRASIDSKSSKISHTTITGDSHKVALELIDPWEMETLYVAMTPEQVTSEHTHVEIHPSTIFGIMGTLIPYAPHNQGPRNLYSCAQSKQATSVYSKAFRSRYDHSAMVLMSPQRPIANTWWGRRLGDSGLSYGANLIVAIACFSGYNQEDGVLLNKTSLQRGLFRVVKTTEASAYEEKNSKTNTTVRIVDPRTVQGITGKKKMADYGSLLQDGTLPEGTPLRPGMVIFGKISETDGSLPRDVSVVAGRFAKGIVESKVILRLPGGQRLVKYRIATLRSPELGDKFSSRAGQKGTCGMLIPEQDMPRTPEGIVPDLVVNPHAIPSRMTIGQIQEVVVSKLGAVLGCEVDATAFTQHGVFGDNIANLLRQNGFDAYGDEMMYSGVTGEVLHSKIFIGPTYYMRLKHMSADKINYRGGGIVDRGPVDARTRQPIGGRAREGGLRIGEMERDSVISHGAARFLQESLTVRADGEHSLLCAESGKQAIRGDGKTVYPGLRSVERDGPFNYRGSTADTLENTTHTTKVTRYSEIPLPRGLRVLTQEMEAMGIDTRFFTDGGAQRLRSSMISGKPVIPRDVEPSLSSSERTDDDIGVQVAMGYSSSRNTLPVPEHTADPPEPSLADALAKYVEQQGRARNALGRNATLVSASASGGMGDSAAIAAQIKQGETLQDGLLGALEVAQQEAATAHIQPTVPPPSTPSVVPAPQPVPMPAPAPSSEPNPQESEKIIVVKKEG